MNHTLRSVFFALSVLSVGLLVDPRGVAADAVPPPPDKCPPGYIGITSHAGPQCVLKPPISCPPGWRPANGGICILHACETDANCATIGTNNLRCKPAKICIHEYLQEWGWGASLPTSRDDRALFSAPPRRFDPPRRVQEPVDVCHDGHRCPADSSCGQMKLCLPADRDKPGFYQRPALPPSPIYPSLTR